LLSNQDRHWYYTIFYEGDSETFHQFARAIVHGGVHDSGIPFHPPAFPHFLAFIHSLIGAGAGAHDVPHLAVKIAMAFVGSLSVGLIYLVSRPFLGRALALTASALCLYSFGLYVFSVAPLTESLYLTLLLLGILVWSRFLSHPLSVRDLDARHGKHSSRKAGESSAGVSGKEILAGLSFGLLLGLSALTRAEAMLVGAILWGTGVVGSLIVYRRRLKSWRFLAPWAAAVAAFVLVLTPWTLRNAQRMTDINYQWRGRLSEPLPTFVPITAYGPLNFAFANNELSDGSFSRKILPSSGGERVLDLSDPEHLHLFLHGYSVGLEYIRGHPGDFLKLVLRKWGIFFEAWKLGWTQWNLPGGLNGLRRPVDLFVPHSHSGVWLQLPLAILGLVVLLWRSGGPRRWCVLVLLLTLSGMMTTALFFGYVRQGALLLPFWMSLVAAGLGWIAGRLRLLGLAGSLGQARPPLGWLRILGFVALALLAIEIWGATTHREYQATGTRLPGKHYLNPDAVMYLEVLKKEDEGPAEAAPLGGVGR
jgi:hypothetical protein